MAGKRKPKPDDPTQSKRFEEMAEELGADKSGRSFKRAVDTLIPPVKKPKPAKDKG